eukprot:363203-Chlamydomonas_euryale.AAC.20
MLTARLFVTSAAATAAAACAATVPGATILCPGGLFAVAVSLLWCSRACRLRLCPAFSCLSMCILLRLQASFVQNASVGLICIHGHAAGAAKKPVEVVGRRPSCIAGPRRWGGEHAHETRHLPSGVELEISMTKGAAPCECNTHEAKRRSN